LVTRQAIKAVRALPADLQESAIATLIDPDNINVLAPAFITVMRLLRQLVDEVGIHTSGRIDNFLIGYWKITRIF